jgi:hypothetical protein
MACTEFGGACPRNACCMSLQKLASCIGCIGKAMLFESAVQNQLVLSDPLLDFWTGCFVGLNDAGKTQAGTTGSDPWPLANRDRMRPL